MRKRVDHRPSPSWRRRHVFAALGLRRPAAQHSEAERDLLERYAGAAGCIVELGVAEGGSAYEIRGAMREDAKLVLVDPYFGGWRGISMARIVARRLVNRLERGSVVWDRTTSVDAAKGWTEAIDFLFIDADHSLEAVRRDWSVWSPFVRRGGHVALHDARVFDGGWTTAASGPVIAAKEIGDEPEWALVDAADSTVVFRRVL